MHYSEERNSFSFLAKWSGAFQLWTENTVAIRPAFFVSLPKGLFIAAVQQCFITHKIITQKHVSIQIIINLMV